MNIHEELKIAILDADRERALNLVKDWAKENPIETVVQKVLEPVLAKLSAIWEGLIEPPLAPAYVTSRLIREIMEMMAKSKGISENKPLYGPVVICNIEDDFHSLGREVLVAFLEANGWEVIDLGSDVIANELIDKAVEVGAKVVGVSAMMLTTAMNIKSVREELNSRNLSNRIQLAVGGAIFTLRETLIDEVEGDGTCKSAVEAHALFLKLWKKAEEAEACNE